MQGAHIIPSISAAANAAVGTSTVTAGVTTTVGSTGVSTPTTTSFSHSQPGGLVSEGMEFDNEGFITVETTKKRVAHTRSRSPPKDKESKMQRVASSRGNNTQ